MTKWTSRDWAVLILVGTIPLSMICTVFVSMSGAPMDEEHAALIGLLDLLKFIAGGVLGLLGHQAYETRWKRRNGDDNGAGSEIAK